jgi:fructose-1,6-bisphosphatase I
MNHSVFENIFKDINNYLRYYNNMKNNKYDIQKYCESVFIEKLQKNITNNNLKNIICYISKYTDNIQYFENNNTNIDLNNSLLIAFNPIDGVSNYESNINLGSIYCIYNFNKNTNTILGIVDCGYCLYGINTIMIYSNSNKINSSILNNWNNFTKIEEIQFNNNNNNNNKIYSIKESKFKSNTEITFLIQQYKNNNYNMRYIGSFIADSHRILINDGIFYYPDNYKLSYLYEAIPMSYIFKLSDGIGLDGNYKNLLTNINNYKISNIHLKTNILLTSNFEYNNLLNLL